MCVHSVCSCFEQLYRAAGSKPRRTSRVNLQALCPAEVCFNRSALFSCMWRWRSSSSVSVADSARAGWQHHIKNTSGLHRLAESCEWSQQATVNTGESRWQKQIILFEKYFTADTYNTLIILIYICIKYTLNMIIFKDLIHYRQVGQGDINKENTLL